MPLVVDKDAVRLEILMAFQRCIESKLLDRITLRDIAAKPGFPIRNCLTILTVETIL